MTDASAAAKRADSLAKVSGWPLRGWRKSPCGVTSWTRADALPRSTGAAAALILAELQSDARDGILHEPRPLVRRAFSRGPDRIEAGRRPARQ